MKNLHFEYLPCHDIVKLYGKKLEARFDALYNSMKEFLVTNDLIDCVEINKLSLSTAIIDYFNDVSRIKDFHTDIEKINSEKVVAYTAYWILQRSPLQVSASAAIDDRKLATINERFVAQYICDYLSERQRESHIFLRKNEGLVNFVKYLLYYLIYRLHDAQSLEMMITAFMAGQIYERIDEDISSQLHPYDA